jgi:hypothetical protein
MSEETIVTAIGREQDTLMAISYQLDTLANAFFRLGNELLGEEMGEISKALKKSSKNLGLIVGKEVQDRLLDAQNSARATLEVALMCFDKRA